MKWKSPRRAPAARWRRWPALLRRYPRARYRDDRAAVLEGLRAVHLPEPERALAVACPTSSPAGSASGS